MFRICRNGDHQRSCCIVVRRDQHEDLDGMPPFRMPYVSYINYHHCRRQRVICMRSLQRRMYRVFLWIGANQCDSCGRLQQQRSTGRDTLQELNTLVTGHSLVRCVIGGWSGSAISWDRLVVADKDDVVYRCLSSSSGRFGNSELATTLNDRPT